VSPGQKCGVDTRGERGWRAYNGALGAEPPTGPGQSPLKLKTFQLSDALRKQKIRLILRILQTGESSSKRDRPLTPRRVKNLSD